MSADARQVCWLNACFKVPADWEIIAYSIEERMGRLEFGTRLGFQGLFSWEPSNRAPDIKALFASFPVRPGKTRKEDQYQTAEVGRFILGWGSAEEPCLAIAFLANAKKLLRWVFPTSGREMRAEEIKPILASVEPNEGDLRRCCAFGLDFRIPAEYRIEHAKIRPADVELLFESPNRARAFFHRWGLPDALLQGRSLEAYYTDFLRSAGAHVRLVRRVELLGMEALEALYSQTGEHHMDRFMGRQWTNGIGRLWHDRIAKRLYACEQIGPSKVALPAFETLFGKARS